MTDSEKYNLHKAGLLLGSNLGDKKLNLEKAVKLLTENAGKVTAISSIYETDAWGKQDQPSFYNRAIVVETFLTPEHLLDKILEIEKQMGRYRQEKWGPRIIDIDILFYDDRIVDIEDLQIPHPQLHKRKFALIPIAEIEPEWIHPQLKTNIKTLISECEDSLAVKVLK